MATYFRLEPAIHDLYGIESYPELPPNVSFLTGKKLSAHLSLPLRFEINHPSENPPRHFLGQMIPVASAFLIELLRSNGAENFEWFPAILRNQSGQEFSQFHAMNVFERVKPDEAIFRSKEGDILIHENLRVVLKKNMPTEGWGITLIEMATESA